MKRNLGILCLVLGCLLLGHVVVDADNDIHHGNLLRLSSMIEPRETDEQNHRKGDTNAFELTETTSSTHRDLQEDSYNEMMAVISREDKTKRTRQVDDPGVDTISKNPEKATKIRTNDNIIQPRIVGGEISDVNEFPYFVDMPRCDGPLCAQCAGTLIGPDIVLGAAHCGDYMGQIATVGRVRRDVVQQRIYPNYVPPTGSRHPTYDFSLYQLSPSVTTTTGATVTVNKNENQSSTGQPLTVIGVGLTSPAGNLSTALRDVVLITQNSTSCRAGLGMSFNSTTMLCAGPVPTSPPGSAPFPSGCHGDSGGPAIIRNGNSHVVVGVISYGNCGVRGANSAFARISAITSWIESVACTEWGSSVNGLCQQTPVVSPTARPVTSPTRRPRACKALKFKFHTDFYPEENIITLKNSQRTLWDYRSLSPDTDYFWRRCIPNSRCTILNVTDTLGDGLARNGYMTVRYGSKVLFDGWDIRGGFGVALGNRC